MSCTQIRNKKIDWNTRASCFRVNQGSPEEKGGARGFVIPASSSSSSGMISRISIELFPHWEGISKIEMREGRGSRKAPRSGVRILAVSQRLGSHQWLKPLWGTLIYETKRGWED